MPRTAADVTDEEVRAFRAGLRERLETPNPARDMRLARARLLAQRASGVLRTAFGARRVVLFGSSVRADCFTAWSDVDIAAWGIRPEDTFRAMGAMQRLDAEIQVNLVDVATASPALVAVIEGEGQEL